MCVKSVRVCEMCVCVCVCVVCGVGLGELGCCCFRYYAMPAIPGNVIIMLPEEAVLCSYYAQLCNGILPLTQGMGQANCCKLADYGCMQL